jgi:hypothetical protein
VAGFGHARQNAKPKFELLPSLSAFPAGAVMAQDGSVGLAFGTYSAKTRTDAKTLTPALSRWTFGGGKPGRLKGRASSAARASPAGLELDTGARLSWPEYL